MCSINNDIAELTDFIVPSNFDYLRLRTADEKETDLLMICEIYASLRVLRRLRYCGLT